ncbi:MAG: hypothetical protein HY849_05935 [Nitrosomonadales bacterium]|nr:hypothetical protein [Nitrosomonadales bacterium]
MGVKTFIYCDFCNPSAIRFVDRRVPERSLDGRRNSDSRSFIDGGGADALASGWKIVDGRHFCPRCIQHAHKLPAAESSSEQFSAQRAESAGGLVGVVSGFFRSRK